MKKLIMLITAISLLPAYIFAAGNVLNDEKLDKAISNKIEQAKRIYEVAQEREAIRLLPPYMAIRYYMDKDDGEGLKRYITKYKKDAIKPDDFYDVYSVKYDLGTVYLPNISIRKDDVIKYVDTKIHKFCYALKTKKYNVAKALIDLDKFPKGCGPMDLGIVVKRLPKAPYGIKVNNSDWITVWKKEKRLNTFAESWDKSFHKYASEYDSVLCYALKQEKMKKEWEKFGRPSLARKGNCIDEYMEMMPMKKLLNDLRGINDILLKPMEAEDFKKMLRVRGDEIKLDRETLIDMKTNNYYEEYMQDKEISAFVESQLAAEDERLMVKKADEKNKRIQQFISLRPLDISEEKWENLINEAYDEFSFGEESLNVLSKLPKDDLSLDEQKESYNKLIKDLDNAYKKYVESLAGDNVLKKAKENYEFSKKILKNKLALCEKQLNKEKEQKTQENRYNKLAEAFGDDNEKTELFLKILGKQLDDNESRLIYFPNGGDISGKKEKSKDAREEYSAIKYEYIKPVIIFIKDASKEYSVKYVHYSDYYDDGIPVQSTKTVHVDERGYNMTVYNSKGEILEQGFYSNIKGADRKEPASKYFVAKDRGIYRD